LTPNAIRTAWMLRCGRAAAVSSLSVSYKTACRI
jgi:hypothetical protein